MRSWRRSRHRWGGHERVALQDAFDIARRHLAENVQPVHAHEIVIASCTEYPTAWVFGYNTRASLTGDFTAGLLGTGPVIVGKADGSVTLASSAFPVEQQLPPQA